MKILHISSEASWRGGEQQIAYLINESRAQGIDCHVITRSKSSFSLWCRENRIPFKELLFRGSLNLKAASAIKNYCSINKIDLVHIHSGKGHGLYALSTLLGLKTPAILSRRVDFPIASNPWAKWKYNLPLIKKIICVSDAIKRITENGVIEKSKLVTIYSGIDLERFKKIPDLDLHSEYGIEKSKTLIGNVAALAPHKDHSTFLQTVKAAAMQDLNCHFLIVGEGKERIYIENQIEALDISEYVTMTGFRNDIPALLKALDVFMITSETEGLGTSVLDAFAANTPVLATAAGGIPEVVLHGRTGLQCDVKDHECLISELVRLISDVNLRTKLIEGASEHLKEFTKEQTALKTIAIYKEALDRY